MLDKALAWIDKHLLVLLLGVLLIRAAFLWTSGLDLIGDESYYWDWSRQPDWCYYSKPPMVAWLIGLATWLFGGSTAIVRLPTLILGTVFLVYFHATAAAFFGRRAAAMALLLILATPINVIANLLMTIDPPLYCFWIMTLYYLWRALFDGDENAWLWAGCASAAALLSKQSALILPAMLLLFLLIDRQRRIHFKRGYWLYLLPILVAAIPILWWNHQHGWVMFGHSRGHFGNHEPVSLIKHLQWSRDFVLYQILLLSPVTFVLCVIVSLQGALNFKSLTAEQQFLWLMGPVLILSVLLLSVLQKAQGNWPMPFYVSALILLVGHWVNGAWQKTVKFAAVFGGVMVVMTYTLPLLLQLVHLKDTAFDPTKRFKNWREVAQNIYAERMSAQTDLADTFVVALGHRYLASQLAFYSPDHPRVYRFEESGQVNSQYEVWHGPQSLIGKNAFVIGESPVAALPTSLKQAFASFELVAEVANPDTADNRYYIYLGRNLIEWPIPAQP
ncbi:MAG: ArnT family glycosyltransferase [Gammaproteobacteria bacterium]